jgi:hypothetical protein
VHSRSHPGDALPAAAATRARAHRRPRPRTRPRRPPRPAKPQAGLGGRGARRRFGVQMLRLCPSSHALAAWLGQLLLPAPPSPLRAPTRLHVAAAPLQPRRCAM